MACTRDALDRPVRKRASCISEKFGLRVGEDYYGISSPNIAEVIKRVDKAADAGERDADVSGLLDPIDDDGPPPPDRIPVNEQSRAALASLEPFAQGPIEEGADEAEETEQAWDAATQGKLFLVVRDNFEEVEFAPLGLTESLHRRTL